MSHRLIVAVAVTLVVGGVAQAQDWTQAPPNIYYTGGNVGIGTTNPTQALEVNGNVRITPSSGSFAVGGVAPSGYQFFSTSSSAFVSAGFQLQSNYSGNSASYIGDFGNFGTYLSHNREPQLGGFTNAAQSPNQFKAGQIVVGDSERSRLFQVMNFPGGTETIRFFIGYDGNVGIGTITPTEKLHVEGNINVTGNINAKYQDVAEWVTATSDLQPGTVVVLNPERDNEVMASARPYDTSVAGVVSAQPGLTLGETAATKEQIATVGRVRVRVDARRAPIAVGDLLVTSDRPGVAMKSMPLDLGGVAIHRPGTILGKALQALPEGEGEILVLLSLQ
jgi:hypothetical protein